MSNIEAYMNSLDTYIDVLKEESARLSDMITKLNDKIQEAETEKKQLIKEQNEPKFEISQDEKYYFIDFNTRGYNLVVTSDVYVDAFGDKDRVDQNNCFKTKERAKEALDKIKFLLKLERLRDIYCPDYKPNWSSDENKYLILYSYETNRYSVGNAIYSEPSSPCFPTRDIAQKVCDILNSEE